MRFELQAVQQWSRIDRKTPAVNRGDDSGDLIHMACRMEVVSWIRQGSFEPRAGPGAHRDRYELTENNWNLIRAYSRRPDIVPLLVTVRSGEWEKEPVFNTADWRWDDGRIGSWWRPPPDTHARMHTHTKDWGHRRILTVLRWQRRINT